jgi:hypothetical protein
MSKQTRYKVSGPTSFQGHRPGEEFEADLDPELERRAKERGSIRVVRRGDEPDNGKGKDDG